MELYTERLLLQNMQLEHSEALYLYRSDEKINQYQGWIPYGIEDCCNFIKNKVAKELDQVGTWYQFVIMLKKDSKIIGDIGIHFLDEEGKQVELGCTLAKAYQGVGYASEAVTQIISFLFNKLDKHRITASIDPRNIPSIKMVEKLGFRKEAHFKKSILMNGLWLDDVIYALLKEEWIENTMQKRI